MGTRRKVLFQKYERVPEERLKPRQSRQACDWSEEWHEGYFLEFTHLQSTELFSHMLIECPDGTIESCPTAHCKFVVDL